MHQLVNITSQKKITSDGKKQFVSMNIELFVNNWWEVQEIINSLSDKMNSLKELDGKTKEFLCKLEEKLNEEASN